MLLGLDIGTGSAEALLLDEQGKALAAASYSAPADLPALSPAVTLAAEPRNAEALTPCHGRFLELRRRLAGRFGGGR